MNKGQFPLAIASMIVIVLILKMPAEDVSKLVFALADELHSGEFLGYMLFAGTTGGWFFHARWQRKIMNAELDRLSAERTKLQTQKLGKKIKSSKEAK